MLASFPASMLNQKSSDLGILNRFKLDPSRSSQRSEAAVALASTRAATLRNGCSNDRHVGKQPSAIAIRKIADGVERAKSQYD
jgi:hypothetical protein